MTYHAIRIARRRWPAISAALMLSCFAPMFGQQEKAPAAATPTISAQAKLVNLPVVVRDKKGALVQGLTKDDFVLEADHHPQTIRYFDVDANLPLTLGLLVDTSLSQRSVLDDERTASSAFLDKMLTPGRDKAFLIQFATQTELLQDLTDSRPKLQQALKEIDSPGPGQGSGSSDPDSGRQTRRGGTALYDATFLASDELMAKQKGRKAIILLTDGEDRNSKETIAKAIEAAQRSDTTLYAIYFKGEEPHTSDDHPHNGGGGRPGVGFPGVGFPGSGRGGGGGGGNGGGPGNGGGSGRGGESRIDGKKILERMTQETGGRMFEVTKKQTVAQIYSDIGDELRAQYRLGYTPDAERSEEGYHEVELTLKDPKRKLIVQTREGYYAGK